MEDQDDYTPEQRIDDFFERVTNDQEHDLLVELVYIHELGESPLADLFNSYEAIERMIKLVLKED